MDPKLEYEIFILQTEPKKNWTFLHIIIEVVDLMHCYRLNAMFILRMHCCKLNDILILRKKKKERKEIEPIFELISNPLGRTGSGFFYRNQVYNQQKMLQVETGPAIVI